MMDGPTSIRPQSPDWRHTHTAASAITSKYSTSIPKSFDTAPHVYSSATTKSFAPLPPLAHLDLAKIIRDDHKSNSNESNHLSPITATTMSTMPSLNSPASGYPGPPPPYSSLVTTPSSTTITSYAGYPSQTAPEPRRTYEEERETQPSQSLPSIHEALSKEPAPFYRGPPQMSSNPPPPPTIMTAPSPTTPIHRSYPNSISSHTQNLYDSHLSRSTDQPPRSIKDVLHRENPTEEVRKYPTEPQSAHRPPPLPQSPHISNQSQSRIQSQPATPSFFPNPPPHPAAAPPQQSQQFTPTYPPAYSYPPPSVYSPANGPWRNDSYSRPEDTRRGPPPNNPMNSGRRSPGAYHHGESVKRHLETFDFEVGLNDIAAASKRTLDFARNYSEKAHHMHRSGIATALPSLDECDEMQALQREVLNSMERIREIVVTQQHALAEQRSREEASKARQASYAEHSSAYDKQDGEGGFAGPDPKKRRGRHAPPGRCHSCARSETPEWRRGPDGARTLCNACGLHYAKLTRKLGTKISLPGGSNLRPKENEASSP